MIKLNHIGIAVRDLPALTRLFALLGIESDHVEAVPEQGVRTHFLPIQADLAGSAIEFLEVMDPQGTVAQFIEKRGPGIHHLSFTVAPGELDPLCAKIRAEGFRLIYEKPRPGAHHMKVNFIHPASAGGILLELMEPTGEK